ncbi:glucose-6-phosphate 1-dehydrogenase [Ktedonobacter sp. SOSP1-52]|uniref:glucose-6-phosphate dehydrogenase n=1 Tax=Ktedonobacter sp. SOSP1-52 TaxID=2778366 RepID=UPI001916CA25|nr:glucose-6-phosphate dehydrogenase [Ktedonobacter sp. SOSP1-52]GHO67037.1 glucose-6-phosphate 1-dehydrogenase [Ktedonobacter sp. SOSP1-52]
MPQRSVVEAPNPFREGLRIKQSPEPCVMVIFGATGDLTHRKLLPALYNLALEHPLPAGFSVVAFARRPYNDEVFRKQALDSINEFSRQKPVNEQVWESFSNGIFYLQSDFHEPEGYEKLAALLNRLDQERGTSGNRIFYLSTPPSQYPTIIQNLGAVGLNRNRKGWTRIIVEKPFGHDLPSARELNRQIGKVFKEDQIYRIDHYLGKETVQNILVFRLANGIFEPIWNRRYIDHVQITVAENIGIEGRGGYYEESGAIRDMIQNHMLQLLTLVAMEPPIAFDANAVRDEKVKVLHALQPLSGREALQNTIRAQYTAGYVGGHQVGGYLSENGVSPESSTETYVAMKLFIDNWRWAGVPFYLRTGKHLPKRVTEIAIQFKQPPLMIFKQNDAQGQVEPNVLTLRIQPDEGISLKFGAKVPGTDQQIRSVNMDFFYGSSFVREQPEAYERLLLDAMLGDSTLFTRRDEVEAAWTFVQGILDAWKNESPATIHTYESGTWGPQGSDEFIWRDGFRWRRP